MTLPRLGTPTADDIDLQLRQRARLNRLSRVLKGLGLMKLEDTPDVGLTNFKTKMAEAPQDILSGLRRLGRTPDSETFLRSLKPEIDEDGLTSIFGKLPPVQPPPISPVSDVRTAPFQMPEPPTGELRPATQEESSRQEAIISRKSHYWSEATKTWKPISQPADVALKLPKGRVGEEVPLSRMPFSKQIESLGEVTPFKEIGEVMTSQEAETVKNTLGFIGLIGSLVLTGGQGIGMIRDMTAWRRLPEYKEMVLRAKEAGMPRSSKVFKDAETALKSAVNLHRGGAYEAAQEIMSRYYATQARYVAGTAAAKARTPAEKQAVTRAIMAWRPTLTPKGTQTGAMAFGGLPKKIPTTALERWGRPLTGTQWDTMGQVQRDWIAEEGGLSKEAAYKRWEELTLPEQQAAKGIAPPPLPTAPVTPVTPEVRTPIDRNIRWRVPTKTGEAAVTITKEGKYQFTPAYPSTERQTFDRFEDAIAELKKVGEISEVNMATKTSIPFEPTNLEVGSTAELGIEKGKPFTDDFGHTWTMGKEAGTKQFKLDTVVQGQRISIWARKQSGWQVNRADALAKLKQAELDKRAGVVSPAEPVAPTPEEQLQIFIIKTEPIRAAREQNYEVHKLSPKNTVDKGAYEEGYRYRLSKQVEGKPYPDIVMARNEKEISAYLLKQRVAWVAENFPQAEPLVGEAIQPTETGGMVAPIQPPVPLEAGGEGGLRPPLTTPPPEQVPAGAGEGQPPAPPITASGIPDPPPSITPGPMAQNVIGLRAIQPGLTRQQTINNWMRRQFGKAYKKIGGRDLVLEDALATPAIVERARVAPIIESQANDLAAKIKVRIAETFKLDKQGRVPALADVSPDIGAPTIQDIAARLPLYRNSLTPQELEVFSFLKESVQPYHDLMVEVGVELRRRADVMEGGFYLPRSFATPEDADLPYKVGGGRGGMKKGFEKPAVFDSMAQGIEAGYKYPSLSDAVANYARGAGKRATDAHVVNYFKALTDDTGNLLGETPKIRMLRQNPEIAKPVEDIKANLVKLKSNIGALTQRQMDVIDLWANDPDFADTSAVIISLQEGLATMKGGRPAQTLRELRALLKQNIDGLKALKPSYDKAMRQAQVTPREQGAINVNILPGLQGRTFPVELSNAVNIVLNQEGALTGRGAAVMNITNAFNALWAMGHATADLSASGIQGLLLLYNHPLIWSKAFGLNVKTLFSDKVAGEYLLNFDAREKKAGRLTSAEWNRSGSRMSGEAGFLETIGVSEKIMNLPIIKQSNRAFSLFGDIARKEWNSSELRAEMAKGRTLEEITASGELERISFGSNVMTGWSQEGFGSSIGQTILFAPRWLQSRLSTLTLAAKGLRPGATKDQAMARNAILKLIAFGTLITVALNAVQDEETDFRLIVDGKRNPHFMRVRIPLPSGKVMYVSLFGSWDSLVGMVTHIGTGRPLNALRNMGSGVVAVAFDVITGRDYQWREVGSKPVDPVKLSQWIMRSSVPYAWGDLPETVGLFAEGEVGLGTLRLGGEALGIKSYIEETGAKVQEGISNLGKIDQTGLDAALKQATTDRASLAKIAEIKAKDWTYDIKSLRRDIGDAIQNLSDKEIAKLSPIAAARSEFSKQKDAYGDLSDKEQETYLKRNPDFVVNRIFWGELREIPDLSTAEAVTAKAQAHNIPLNMIPAFQLTDKGKERIPADQELWKPYFDYYALPGNGGYLSYTKEQVDAGKLPAKYLAEWQTFQKLKTDTAKTLFRKNHKEASTNWREAFRRQNKEIDKWLQENEGLKPLEKPAVRRAGGVSQPSIARASREGGRGGGVSFPSRRKAKYPKFRRVAVKRGMSISVPGAPKV